MKFTHLTIDQFQRIAAIEANGDASLKKVAITAVIRNITLEEAKQLPMTEVNAEYKAIEAELKNLPELRFKQSVRLGNKRYRLSLYTESLSAGQLLELMSFNMTDEYVIIQNLHKIMATLARERKWFRTLPYDGASHPKRAEEFKHLKMGDVWGAVAFFLMASDSFLTIIKEFSEATMKKMDKDLASLQSTAG